MSKNPNQKEIQEVLSVLKKRFPQSGALELGNPYKTLTGVLLSARTRDEQVLKLLSGFFERFPDVKALAVADVTEIQSRINTIGMYRQKAKNLKKMAQKIIEDFDGQVPGTIDELTTLAGVGRKTASVVLPHIFDTPAIAVDVHVHRVVNRLEWVQTKNPAKTEQELLNLIPKSLHKVVNQVFVKFGRYICISRKPRCWACPIQDICPYKDKNLMAPKNADHILEKIKDQEEALQALREKVL